MTTTQQLQSKIDELNNEIANLEKRSHINPLTASAQEISKNAQNEQQARENAAHLKSVVAQLQEQLEAEVRSQKSEVRKVEVEANFNALVEQSDRVVRASSLLKEELEALRTMAKAIASKHKRETNKLALDDRIDRNFILPKVEKLPQSIILHNQPRNYLKS